MVRFKIDDPDAEEKRELQEAQEKRILDKLGNPAIRKVMVALADGKPRTAKDINNQTMVGESQLGDYLRNLEEVGAVEHSEHGWKATEIGLAVNTKYFE